MTDDVDVVLVLQLTLRFHFPYFKVLPPGPTRAAVSHQALGPMGC